MKTTMKTRASTRQSPSRSQPARNWVRAAALAATVVLTAALALPAAAHGPGKKKGHHKHHRGHDRVVVIDRGAPAAARYARWSRGMHYGRQGYAPTYVVREYRDYHLHAPPPGHYWRRDVDGNFLLVAAATGIIASVLLN